MRLQKFTLKELFKGALTPDSKSSIATMSLATAGLIVPCVLISKYTWAIGLFVLLFIPTLLSLAYRGASDNRLLIERSLKVKASKWVYEGKTAEERKARKAQLDEDGYEGVLGAAVVMAVLNEGISYNTDGTPMLPGGVIDIHGNTFGDTSSMFSSDVGTGMDLHAGDAYSSPIGMDSTFDSSSGSSSRFD